VEGNKKGAKGRGKSGGGGKELLMLGLSPPKVKFLVTSLETIGA